jgi:hypothetical protein
MKHLFRRRTFYPLALLLACTLVVLFSFSSYSQEDARIPEVSSSPAVERNVPRITYSLEDAKARYTNRFGDYVYRNMCSSRGELPEEIQAGLGHFFAARVETDLKILFVGDSVAFQFFQIFEEAVGSVPEYRQFFGGGRQGKEDLALSPAIQGGGVVAGWKLTGMLRRSGEGNKNKMARPGAWERKDTEILLQQYSVFATNGTKHETALGRFDVMIFRLPHGWESLEKFTEASFAETTELAGELFGVSTVIFISVPFSNNIVTENDMRLRELTNQRLQHFVDNWEVGRSGVNHMMVLEFGEFISSWMENNARLIGFDTSNRRDHYALETLLSGFNPSVSKSIAQMCAKRVPAGSKDCERNSVSVDGMHWCMSTIGGHVVAGLACLLGCAFNPVEHGSLPDCAKACNERFMRLHSTV